MSSIRFLLLFTLLIGCSAFSGNTEKEFAELGIIRSESDNFMKGVAALEASCKQSDSISIQTCQFYTTQKRSIGDMEQFLTASLFSPESLAATDRIAFMTITRMGAIYREYLEAKQANPYFDRGGGAAGAALATFFICPDLPPESNSQVHGSGNYRSGQCQ